MKMRLVWVLSLMMVATASWAQTFNIGGHRAVQDSRNNIWLCSIPQSYFGNDFTATVNYPDSLIDFAIDGTLVASGEDFVFAGVEGGKNYTVTAYVGEELITGNITFTWLPILEMTGDFGKDYSYGTVTVNEPDSINVQTLMAKAKYRGHSANGPSSHKRNYRVRFVNEEDSTKANHSFFGLRNDNNWILDAGQRDFLRVRNRVTTDLWLDMARRPWYADTLPNARGGSRGQVVEVILNGEYNGIYNMCEPIDRKQLKLKRYEAENNNLLHGGLWMAYTWSRTVTMSEPVWLVWYKSEWGGFEYRYPDPDDVVRLDWTPLSNAVYFAGRANDDPSIRMDSLGYFFDIPVMQDYYIFIAATQALDNESKNIYYACRDRQEHPRLTMVPWDLDVCLGQNYAPGVNLPEMVKPERDMSWVSHLPMNIMMEMPEYRTQVIDRYKELRETVLNTDSLVNRYRSAIDELEFSGAAAREEQRWSRDMDLARKVLDLSKEMDYVEDWLRRRMAYLDENIFIEKPVIEYPVGDVDGNGEVNIADVNALIDIILGGRDNSEGRSDVNKDGEVNISDINAVIDIILK